MNIKKIIYIFLCACLWIGGTHMMCTINKLPTGHIKNILFGMSLMVTFFGVQCFFKNIKTLKLIGKCKQTLNYLLKTLKLQ